MGHPLPPTPIQTNNLTAEGVINNKIQPKRTKAMDMRFNWLQCREAQDQFRFYWRPGKQNLADYWTKHHPASHHQNVRAEFLTSSKDLKELRAELQVERAHHMYAGKHYCPHPRVASCKGVLDNPVCTTYGQSSVRQLETLVAQFETKISNSRKQLH